VIFSVRDKLEEKCKVNSKIYYRLVFFNKIILILSASVNLCTIENESFDEAKLFYKKTIKNKKTINFFEEIFFV